MKETNHRWLTVLKVILWTAMAVVLLIIGVTVCAVKMLTPRRLTPLVTMVMNNSLNADVSIAKVELSLKKSYPMLHLDVDSVTIISRALPVDSLTRVHHPAWADTLATFTHLQGKVNVLSMARGVVDLGDFELHGPEINLLIINDSIDNYSIFKTSDADTAASAMKVPDIKLRSFKLVDPRPLRFLNVRDSIAVTATFQSVSISNDPTAPQPAYRIDFASNIDSPLFDFFRLQNMPVNFSGDIYWNAANPYAVTLHDFNFVVQALSGKMSTTVDFNNEIVLNTLDLVINPLSVSAALASISPEAAKKYSIPQDISTNACIALQAKLFAPYNIAQEGLPKSQVNVQIEPCYIKRGNLDLRKFVLQASLATLGPSLNDAVVNIDKLLLQGPATTLDIKCRLSELQGDMLFDGKVNGHVVLDRLPDILRSRIPGSLVGTVSANASFKGRPSMFAPNKFYQLNANGKVDLKNVRYETPDFKTAAQVYNATLSLGTTEKIHGPNHTADSVLTVRLNMDSATILQSNVLMHIHDLSVGAAVNNRYTSADTTTITPLGGRIKTGMFSVFTLTDTAGMRLRGLEGSLAMLPLKGDASLPRLVGNLKIHRISAGDNYTRFMVTNSRLHVHANPKADSRARKRRIAVERTADSIAHVYPSLPMDSVYALALERHRRHRGPHRVHLDTDTLDLEVVDWGASKILRQLLTEWELGGNLTAAHARLFTSVFPVRNRMQNFNIAFSTDTVSLQNVQYKAGHSDFMLSGRISNIARAITSKSKSQSLKLHFDLLSDTIDVNELAHAVFSGAGNERKKLNSHHLDDENALENDLESETINLDARGPLLIPTNIDADIRVRANNVIYSDLLLHNLRGSVLAFDGAINLHNLTASSQVGAVDLSALYSAPNIDRMQFGFGLKLDRFNISQFLKLVPAVDSMMPLMRDFAGVVSANIAATAPIDRHMNISLPLLHAAINVQGDSLTVIDPETFKTMAKWLFFRDKQKNMIDHMSAEMLVQDGVLHLFPFVFDFDRYRIGVQGSSDLAMNLNYHISVLKSPLPFKFGVNIKGNVDKMKISLGRARYKANPEADHIAIVDTTRVNLLKEIENVFRRGVRNSKFAGLNISRMPEAANIDLADDTISYADSLYLIKEGLLPNY